MVDLLVFSAIASSFPSLVATGTAADHFVIEFAVDRWIIHRGPLDSVEDQPPSSFLVFGWCCGRSFPLVYFSCLMVNGENQFFTMMIQPWKSDGTLEMSPLQRLEHRAKKGGKNGVLRDSHFPSPFWIILSSFGAAVADLNLGIKWAGLLLISLVLRLGGWLLGHFSSCLGYRGPLGLLGFGPLTDHWGVGLGLSWTEKMGLYKKENENACPVTHLWKAYKLQQRARIQFISIKIL